MIGAAFRYGLWSCVLVSLASLSPVAPAATVRGAVVDSEGAAIAMAHIVVHEDGTGRASELTAPDVILQSDKRGQFSAEVEPGFYDVCVMAQAFTPHCRKVLVRENQTTNLKIQLEIDLEVIGKVVDKYFGVKK